MLIETGYPVSVLSFKPLLTSSETLLPSHPYHPYVTHLRVDICSKSERLPMEIQFTPHLHLISQTGEDPEFSSPSK